jgi:hypothetical protein
MSLGTDLGGQIGEARMGESNGIRPRKQPICWPFVKCSDGLEPSTPSLPSIFEPLPWVA